MKEKTKQKLILVGLPESGKSTFIAALWDVVTSHKIEGSLILSDFEGDDSYLNELHQNWVELKSFGRTKLGKEGLGIMNLHSASDSTVGTLILPDLSGERFANQWEKRKVLKDHVEHLRESSGLLLFVHSKKIERGELMDEDLNELDEILSTDAPAPEVIEEVIEIELPVLLKHSPTQTILVDLLQTSLDLSNKLSKVSLIISAWDLVIENGLSPIDWLKKKLPLLAQFLESNERKIDYYVFGISAQGGEIDDSEQRARLLKEIDPSKRIIVAEEGKEPHHDITIPVKVLLT